MRPLAGAFAARTSPIPGNASGMFITNSIRQYLAYQPLALGAGKRQQAKALPIRQLSATEEPVAREQA